MQTASDTTYRQVQGLRRGLSILRALNDASGAALSPRVIGERTALNRTTVKRILETLAADGYVHHNDSDGSYGLAPPVLLLSRGLADGEHLMEARLLQHAKPLLDQIVIHTGWCVSLATAHGDSMVLRHTTQPRSDIADEPELRKVQRLPMLFSALGRAYLSQCGEDERKAILRQLQARRDEQFSIARNPRLVELMTQRVRREGYAVQDGDWPGQDRFGAVALPVQDHDGRTVASMSVVYRRRAVTSERVANEFVPCLRRNVEALAAAL